MSTRCTKGCFEKPIVKQSHKKEAKKLKRIISSQNKYLNKITPKTGWSPRKPTDNTSKHLQPRYIGRVLTD